MKISVIIPTYRPQTYLWNCLDSLVVQTFPKSDFEIILVLNGCKEPYENEIRNYLSHTTLQIHFFQTNQSGVSNARNVALDRACGEYIAFIDDDDYVSPSYLEELYAKAAPDTISLCYPYAFNDGEPLKQISYSITRVYNKRAKYGKQSYLKSRKFFGGPCMKLIPRAIIKQRRFDIRFRNGEDSLFMFLISDRFHYVDYTSSKAVYYRRYRDNSAVTTNKSLKYLISNALSVANMYCKYFFKRPFRYNLYFFLTRILATAKFSINI